MSDTATELNLADVYTKAANWIEAHGWVQNKPVGRDEERCASAAINEAAGRAYNELSRDLFEPFGDWLRANRADQISPGSHYEGGLPTTHSPDCSICAARASGRTLIQNWNDEQGRTKEQVLSTLREFAASIILGETQ